jgi:choline dehydrogenase-like flavoprotein/predicted dehydrogenase
MAIDDLRTAPPDTKFDFDICIVGSGPAGLAIAAQFVDSPVKVCVLESGGRQPDARVDILSEVENVGAHRVPTNETRARVFGGTSALWTGRCGILDPIDYLPRAWVPHSGWPIRAQDIERYYDRAGRLLGLGPALYQDPESSQLHRRDTDRAWDGLNFRSVVWQFSQHAAAAAAPFENFATVAPASSGNLGVLQHAGAPKAMHFGEAMASTLLSADNIQVLLNANAVSIEVNENSTAVRSVEIATLDGRRSTVATRCVVLACGAIDNARLLLCSRSVDPRGVGNTRGLVGRFLSDHPFWSIAQYHGHGSDAFRRRLGTLWHDRPGARHVYARGLSLSPEIQQREELLNAALHIVEFGSRRPAVAHAGAALKLARQGRFGRELGGEVVSALRHPLDLASGVHARYRHREPARTHPERVVLGAVVEQVPDPDSRVTLSEKFDALGTPRAKVDWRISDREFSTARYMSRLLRSEFERQGYAAPEFAAWLDDDTGAFRQEVHDMAHSMGTTRMSIDASTGVVDADCQVHGVSGLYVAGGSVFATSGHMNPTLMIVALSVRLADHLKSKLQPRMPSSATTTSPAPQNLGVDNRRLRVGLVGIGDRVRRIYLPILGTLDREYEVVGFAARNPEKANDFAKQKSLTRFDSAAHLVAAEKPDLLIVAVNGIDQVLPSLLDLGTPLLVETPFCWSLHHGRKSLARIKKSGFLLSVAEQTPYLPVEQLKRQLLAHGVLGALVSAHNDFAVYDYHGIAALRAYLGSEQRPRTVSAVRVAHPILRDGAISSDEWTLGTVTCADGTTLVHHYANQYFVSPHYEHKMLRLYGTSGSIAGDVATFAARDGRIMREPIRRETQGGALLRLSVTTPLGEISWRNPFSDCAFNDEQIAVATLLQRQRNAVLFGGAPAYSADDGYQDMEMLTAMRHSAMRDGAPVKLPLGKIRATLNAVGGRLRRLSGP